MQLIHKIYPAAIEEKDESGRLPLHYACRLRASKEVVIHCLIAEYTEADGISASNGTYPLHTACASHQPLEIIQALVDCGEPQIVQKP